MEKWQQINIGLLLLLISCIFFSCGKTDKVIERDLEEFEIKDHIIIGETMKIQIANMPESFTILDSVKYKDAYIYVNRLLSTLKLTAVVKHRNDFNWKVTLLHDDNIRNAFTLPGGYIYVYTGLLKFLNAEHELMAVLGNEIAYADKELTAITLRDEYGGVFLGDIILGKKVPELPEVLEHLPMMEFEGGIVLDADEYAIELICPFQYDINGLQKFLMRAHAHRIQWIDSKKGEDFDSRLENIGALSQPCGEGGVTNLEQYQRKIKNFLPN